MPQMSFLESLKARKGENKEPGLSGIVKRLVSRKKSAEMEKKEKERKGLSREERFRKMGEEANEALQRLRQKRGK